MTTLSKSDILFIRACKGPAEDIQYRLLKLYRKFYYYDCTDDQAITFIIGVLLRIIEANVSTSITHIIDSLNPKGNPFLIDERPYEVRVFWYAVGQIRNAHVDNFPGYVAPAKYRNRNA